MQYLLRKYHPSGSSEETVEQPFGEIADGAHLWVTEYPPEIAKFIDARKKKKAEETHITPN
jgi:hypothetical protein